MKEKILTGFIYEQMHRKGIGKDELRELTKQTIPDPRTFNNFFSDEFYTTSTAEKLLSALDFSRNKALENGIILKQDKSKPIKFYGSQSARQRVFSPYRMHDSGAIELLGRLSKFGKKEILYTFSLKGDQIKENKRDIKIVSNYINHNFQKNLNEKHISNNVDDLFEDAENRIDSVEAYERLRKNDICIYYKDWYKIEVEETEKNLDPYGEQTYKQLDFVTKPKLYVLFGTCKDTYSFFVDIGKQIPILNDPEVSHPDYEFYVNGCPIKEYYEGNEFINRYLDHLEEDAKNEYGGI